MTSDPDRLDDGRLDLVPMIDCIMLLLLFFMMTSRFTPEDLVIGSVLPTDTGPGVTLTATATPPINVVLYPEGMHPGQQPSAYAAQLTHLSLWHGISANACLRIGRREPFLLMGTTLDGTIDSPMPAEVDRIHAYIAHELATYEKPGVARDQQSIIVIHCYSGLSWKFALVTYDAIRAYEAARSPAHDRTQAIDLALARAVAFAQPRVRDYQPNALGEELAELIQLQ